MVSRIIEQATAIRSLSFTAPEALMEECDRHHPLAAFIDINLGSQVSGLDIIPRLRQTWNYCPLIVITSDPADEAVGRALESGANDFIQKPIRPRELVARMQSRFEDLSERQTKNVHRIGDASFDPNHRVIEGPSGKRYLSPTETGLLLCLLHAKGTIVSKQKLKRFAWDELQVSDNALDRKLFELRKALQDVSPTLSIDSVYGKGVRIGKKS